MAPVKVFGWFASGPSLMVALFCYEKNVPFEWVSIELPKGAQKDPEYMAKVNPHGLVPALEDNGFAMFESRAIARYLDEKYPNQGTQFFPKDLEKRALVDSAMYAEAFQHFNFGGNMVFEVLNKRFFNLPTDEKDVEFRKKNLFATYDTYERILSKQKYIAGDELTVADLAHIPVSYRLTHEAGLDFTEGRPNVKRWLNELWARESWQKTRAIYKDLI
ncbi:hypothetical protein D9756_008527 [Leucocoprinus leucothites]|uniref:glutathione transferase n=1 Tax=Leucocoprinus leucothites TaxID=201217 RepID=A0A8H5CZ45_9AGAR|nr:hypothetical protein D9756_008527 [Leucoagaricus leucothites]